MSLEERVRNLGERVQHNQQFLDQEREKQKLLTARQKEIDAAPNMQQMDFWCRTCQKDFIAMGYKRVNEHKNAVYLSACPKGHSSWRYITDIHTDPYFLYSHKVKHDQEKYADYMLTPDDDRFKTVYKKQWLELEKKREENERNAKPDTTKG